MSLRSGLFRCYCLLMNPRLFDRKSRGLFILVLGCFLSSRSLLFAGDDLKPATTKSGYIARLLINEAPFPGERGWVSEANSKATMLAVLWVCHCRLHYIPPGYNQKQVASVHAKNIIDVITAGGEKGQCDGFYRDSSGRFKAVSRVEKRIDYLKNIAGKGKPGKFARLLQYAQGLADAYVAGGIKQADQFAGLKVVRKIPVTGRAYSWMSDKDCYNPGGTFIRIPDEHNGLLGGNRFFTLKKK